MPARDPATRKRISREAAITRHAMSFRRYVDSGGDPAEFDSRAVTRAALDAFLALFEDEVDPQRLLPPAERRERAEALRTAHMSTLARKSAALRKRKAA